MTWKSLATLIPVLVRKGGRDSGRVVVHKLRYGASDHPVCGPDVGFADIFLDAAATPPHEASRGGEFAAQSAVQSI